MAIHEVQDLASELPVLRPLSWKLNEMAGDMVLYGQKKAFPLDGDSGAHRNISRDEQH